MGVDRVILSNGYGQFHLARLAENLQKRGLLADFYTGAYVSGSSRIGLSSLSAVRRLYERRIDVPDQLVQSYWRGEFPHQVAQALRHRGNHRVAESFIRASLDGYAAWAARKMERGPEADVYHFRAGMGGRSVAVASSRGMKTLCDHSIAHPRLLRGLIDGTGDRSRTLAALWSRVERDMEVADGVIVNSEFVAQTCRDSGIAAEKIHVAYTGVDPGFLNTIDRTPAENRFGFVRVVFAGTMEQRKGVDVVIDASERFTAADLEWSLIGSWESDAVHLRPRVPEYVQQIPKLPRAELAAQLARSNVLVFPSRAEGSARVVAEALAAGCYVITTLQSGSVVRAGIDGRIVEPGDAGGICDAVREYSSFSVEERISRSKQTASYARALLSEDAYSASVLSAYESVARL